MEKTRGQKSRATVPLNLSLYFEIYTPLPLFIPTPFILFAKILNFVIGVLLSTASICIDSVEMYTFKKSFFKVTKQPSSGLYI
jgi:hypothetical protein